MSKLPQLSGKDLIKALNKIGYEKDWQRGSHIVLRLNISPFRRITIPNHKEIAKGTLIGIIKQADLTVDEQINLL